MLECKPILSIIQFVNSIEQAGIAPELIYAYEKTGRIVTKDNQKFIPDIELEEWNNAIEEYHRRVESGDRAGYLG